MPVWLTGMTQQSNISIQRYLALKFKQTQVSLAIYEGENLN